MSNYWQELNHSDYWPFAVLFLSVALVVIQITRWRIHPFIALMFSIFGLIQVMLMSWLFPLV